MTPEAIASVMEATWPPAAARRVGPWTIREGQGGGKRVSAASASRSWQATDIDLAEAVMAALGQPALFVVGEGDEALDAALAARGYGLVDPVLIYDAPMDRLADPPAAPMTAFPHWPPLAICAELWAEAGIGPARLAVMERAVAPKAAVLARIEDRPAGMAFVAVHAGVAMLHALEVRPACRRQSSAHNILRSAAAWAQDQGAKRLCLAVLESNAPARALYASLHMQVVGRYHYRQR
jgi:GNAT superfamily N-acetyltransferase